MSMEERPVDTAQSAGPSHQDGQVPAPGRAEKFFSTPELRQRLDLLRHLTDNSEKILLIKGVAGSGKSALLQQFRALSREDWVICPLSADHMLQPDQFFSLLYRRFGLTGPAAMNIDELLKRFAMLQAAGRLPVILIDDAHLLPVATLIALFRLFERRPGSRALIRVVLFATPEINACFQTPQMQAMNLQSVQSLEMPLFDAAQAQAFIEFLLDMEGGRSGLKLPPGRMERIVRESAGVPGVLEERLRGFFAVVPGAPQAAFAPAAARQGSGIRAVLTDLPRSVLIGTPLLLVLLLLTLVYQDEINRLFDASDVGPTVADSRPGADGLLPLRLPDPGSPVDLGDHVSGRNPADAPTPMNESPPDGEPPRLTHESDIQPEPEPEPEPELGLEPESEPLAGSGSGSLVQSANQAELPAETGESRQPATGSAPDAGDTAGASTAQPSADPAELSADALPSAAGADVTGALSAESPEVGKNRDTAPALPEERAGDRPIAEAPVGGQRIRDAAWILSQKPTAYTLQLVAVSDEPAARRFIEQHGLRGDVAYFRTLRAGRPWFSVIYGVHASRSAAIRSRDDLPSALRKSGAWPRNFASVQAAMAE